ncbi:MAG: ribbon-helix-helix protein, CopG family [Jiangellaceae bacterium]
MATITFRTDPEIDHALAELAADGASKSEAIRAAILLASRQRHRERLLEESRRLKNSPRDVAEMHAIMRDMDAISEPW